MADTMTDERLINEMAGLARLGRASQAKSLSGLTELAMRSVPACCAATMTLWWGTTPDEPTGTHPAVVRLVAAQLAIGEGPLLDAVRDRRAVHCDDTLTDTRWPRYKKLALRTGVRSSLTCVEPVGDWLVTLTVWALRPGVLQIDDPTLSSLLVHQADALVTNLALYEDAQRTATQLHQAAGSRALIDQAKGVIMQLHGCDAETAFDQLRAESQRTHTKVVDVARSVIESAQLDTLRGGAD